MGGNDIICGDADQRSGTDGSDRLFGGSGHDTIDGGRGRDRLHGGDGNDYLVGGLGSDLLSGVAGRDRLFGGSGDDQISGGTGDDRLDGGLNKDHCDGGAGIDGGTLCEGETTSIALLSFASVSFHRPPGGGVTCDLLVDIVNEGSEPAKEVRVEATFKTLAHPGPVGADLELKGPADIPVGHTAHYFQNTGVQVQRPDIVRYVVRVHNGATSVDTARSEGGIPCAD
jgi:D-alanyl-D-alanine carboxypeptidase